MQTGIHMRKLIHALNHARSARRNPTQWNVPKRTKSNQNQEMLHCTICALPLGLYVHRIRALDTPMELTRTLKKDTAIRIATLSLPKRTIIESSRRSSVAKRNITENYLRRWCSPTVVSGSRHSPNENLKEQEWTPKKTKKTGDTIIIVLRRLCWHLSINFFPSILCRLSCRLS